MRVTDAMMFERAARDAAAARTRLDQATREASTGLRVQHAEDDPAAAALITRYAAQAARADGLAHEADSASGELGTADGALATVSTVLSRARELTVQMSNATYSAIDRTGAASEVDGLFKSLIAALNTESGGRYLFGGFKDNAPPFTAAGAYVGDTGVRQVEAAPGTLVDASVRADVAIKGVGGGQDVLGVLQALQTALSSNNVAGVQNALTGLDAGIGQVALARSQLGGNQSVLDVASAAAKTFKTDQTSRVSALQDADLIDAASRLAQAQEALNASLTASAKSFQLSLLNKL